MLGGWHRRLRLVTVAAVLVPLGVVGLSLNAMADSPSPSPSASGSASGSATAIGDATKGQQVYNQNCTTCHGASLEGGIGPKLHPIQKLAGVADPLAPDYLIETITNGRTKSDGFPDMPPKGNNPKLSDQDVKDVAAYIIEVNKQAGGAPLSGADLARSNVFWVSVGVGGMVLITYLLAVYNMRWIARRAAARRNR